VECEVSFSVRRKREVKRNWEFIEGGVEDKGVIEIGDQLTASAGDALSEGYC